MDIDPNPDFEFFPPTYKELDILQKHYNPSDKTRLPENWNPDKFKGVSFRAAEGEIRKHLEKRAFNARLKEHLGELRGKAMVHILDVEY